MSGYCYYGERRCYWRLRTAIDIYKEDGSPVPFFWSTWEEMEGEDGDKRYQILWAISSHCIARRKLGGKFNVLDIYGANFSSSLLLDMSIFILFCKLGLYSRYFQCV